MDWRRHRAVILGSDDWGMGAWAPDRVAYLRHLERGFMQNNWSKGTLEGPEDMRRLFGLLSSFHGADGRVAFFQPNYVVALPDYEAISEDGFTRYYDMGLAGPLPSRWQRGDIIGAAREGMEMGVWYPQYHARAHHFSPKRWVRLLKEGNRDVIESFEDEMYVWEVTRERVKEYADMTPLEQVQWVAKGIDYFQEAFGRRPQTVTNGDVLPGVAEAWVANGLRVANIFRKVGFYHDPLTGLCYSSNNTYLDLMLIERERRPGYLDRASEDAAAAWERNEPAVVVTHRTNYVSFDQEDVEINLGYLSEFLSRMCEEGVVFLTEMEALSLQLTGLSAIAWPKEIVVRNYSDADGVVRLELGKNEVQWVRELRTDMEPRWELQDSTLVLSTNAHREYVVTLS
jgi:hypothetical protein